MIELPRLPSGEELPLPYRWIRAHGLQRLTPWLFVFDDQAFAQRWREKYRQRHTRLCLAFRDAWPFASRQDRMEVAAFELRRGRATGKVIVVDEDFCDQWGGKVGGTLETYQSFMYWLASALSDAEVWMTEEDLADILEEMEPAEE